MTDDELLAICRDNEDRASQLQHGELQGMRDAARHDYDRLGYKGDEQRRNRFSTFVSSDVHDAVETLLPDMLDVFFAGDKVCEFTPRREIDEEGAENATEACNYVFEKLNNGFVKAHTLIKDALQLRLGVWHWHCEEVTKTEVMPFGNLSEMQLAKLLRDMEAQAEKDGSEIEVIEHDVETQEIQADLATGPEMVQTPIYSIKVRRKWKEKQIKIDNVPPDQFLCFENHTSPILEDCRYTAILQRVTLSDLAEMGFPDITAEDMGEDERVSLHVDDNDDPFASGPRRNNHGLSGDESQRETWLRWEYVVVDYDGDGIAELRRIRRLANKILDNEPCSHVEVAITSPYLQQHRWDGSGLWDHLHDVQKSRSQAGRDVADSLSLAARPRKVVNTQGTNWTPLVHIGDLQSDKIGGVIRTRDGVANLGMEGTPFVGADGLGYMEWLQSLSDERVGPTRFGAGLDADSLNKTARGAQITQTNAQKRRKLIARIIAETAFVPMFKGILKLLTEGGMPTIETKIKGRYRQFNPEQWRDDYDMSVSVGLGTGDKEQTLMQLENIFQKQMGLLGVPAQDGVPLVTPKNLYNTVEKIAENSGFHVPGEFALDPESDDANQMREANKSLPPPPDPLEVQLKDMEGKQKLELEKAKAQADQQKQQFEAKSQSAQDDFEAKIKSAQDGFERNTKLLLAQFERETKLLIEQAKANAQHERKEDERSAPETVGEE